MARSRTEILPVVPLRGRVVFPNTTLSFDVGRIVSLTAVKNATEKDSRMFICAQKDAEKADVTVEDLYTVGTVAQLKQVTRLPGNNIRISVQGLYRAAVRVIDTKDGAFIAEVDEVKPVHGEEALEEAYFRTAKNVMRDISLTDTRLSKDAISALDRCADPDEFVNLAAHYVNIKYETKQAVLECESVVDRLRTIDKILNDELEISRLEKKINSMVRQNIDKKPERVLPPRAVKSHSYRARDDEEERKS